MAMKTPLRRLLPDPELDPGEHIVWKHPVVIYIDRQDIGGTLYLTDRALIFKANLLNLPWLRRNEKYPLTSIRRIELVERTWTHADGGYRRRMRIVRDDGSERLFVVFKDPEKTIAYLSEMIHAPA
jgi:hypothetical protein